MVVPVTVAAAASVMTPAAAIGVPVTRNVAELDATPPETNAKVPPPPVAVRFPETIAAQTPELSVSVTESSTLSDSPAPRVITVATGVMTVRTDSFTIVLPTAGVVAVLGLLMVAA
jgi:hypothetical protein